MARKPQNFERSGFTPEQVELLDFLDFVGNNAWPRNGETETLMLKVLRECSEANLSLDQIRPAMKDIGYRPAHRRRRFTTIQLPGSQRLCRITCAKPPRVVPGRGSAVRGR